MAGWNLVVAQATRVVTCELVYPRDFGKPVLTLLVVYAQSELYCHWGS